MNSDERKALVNEQALKIGEELSGQSMDGVLAGLCLLIAELRVDINYLLEF